MECSGKQQYETEELAALMAAKLEGKRPEPLFWYECSYCKKWHLTRQTKNNICYYVEMKRYMLNRHKTTVVPGKTTMQVYQEKLSEERKKLIENKPTLEQAEQWNKDHPDMMISIKKLK